MAHNFHYNLYVTSYDMLLYFILVLVGLVTILNVCISGTMTQNQGKVTYRPCSDI